MSKSLFGQDQERLHRTTAEESKEHFQPIDCRIVKTISNYKQLEDLSSREIVGIKKVLSMLEEDTLEIKTGVYFLVVTEDNRFALVPSPKTEDELRGLYGSDANLIGRILSIRTLNKDLHNIQRKDVEFKASEKEALEDPYFVERKLYPNVDFYSGIIYRALGIPTEMFTVMFALGRLPGWIAQWKEMRKNNEPIGRPRQVYIGENFRDFVPVENR